MALTIGVILIVVVWVFGIFSDGKNGGVQEGLPPAKGEFQEETFPSLKVPQIDWDFVSFFGDYTVLDIFSSESVTSGRENPFLPY